MISQVALPDGAFRIIVIAVVVSVAVLAMIGFSVRKTSKKMGLTDSTAGCLAIFVPILLVILAVWGLSIFNQYQSPSVEPHQPEDLPQYEQEMRQELEMQRMKSL
jgi:amino acid transporter